MIINISEVDMAALDGGGRLVPPRLPTPDEPHNALYNDMILNGVEVDGGYVPWHPVIEARAIYPFSFIATKFNTAFLWHEGGPTGECLCVPYLPDLVCAPCVPDAVVVPSGGKPC
jgi:hypothetical protein